MSDTSRNGLAALSGTLLGIAIATVALRFQARYRQKATLQVDDWLMVPALILFAGLTAIAFYGISQHFIGYTEPHNVKLVDEVHPEMEKTYFSLDAIAVLTLGLAKLSALFFYRRIFCSVTRDAFHAITIVAIAVVALWALTFFIMTLLICGPNLSSLWIPGGSAKCRLVYPYQMGTTISDFLLDVFILCLPIPKIWSLHMTIKRKIAISAVFCLALVGVGASAARMALCIHLVTVGRPVNDEDSYQSNTSWAFFVILEAGLTIIAVNLPSLWYYMADITPERVLRSVRSIVSLGSGRGSQGSQKTGYLVDKQAVGNGSTREQSLDTSFSHSDRGAHRMAYPEERSVETYSMTNMPEHRTPAFEDITPAAQGIQVNYSIQHSEEKV